MTHIIHFMLPCIWVSMPDSFWVANIEMNMVTAARIGKRTSGSSWKPEAPIMFMPRKLALKPWMEAICSAVRAVQVAPFWIMLTSELCISEPLAMPSSVQAAWMASTGMPRMYWAGR